MIMNTQMINFSIPSALLQQADRVAQKQSQSRSEFLRNAIRQVLDKEKIKSQLFSIATRSAKRNNLSEEEALALAEEAKQWARKKSK